MDILDAQSMRPGGVEHQVSDPAIIPLTETKSRDERIILETHRTDRPRRTGTLLQAEPQRACSAFCARHGYRGAGQRSCFRGDVIRCFFSTFLVIRSDNSTSAAVSVPAPAASQYVRSQTNVLPSGLSPTLAASRSASARRLPAQPRKPPAERIMNSWQAFVSPCSQARQATRRIESRSVCSVLDRKCNFALQ